MPNDTNSLSQLLIRLWHYVSIRRRVQLSFLVALMLIASFAEVISIGLVLPFLAILLNPEKLFENNVLQPLFQYLELNSSDQILLPVTIIFCITVLIAALIRTTLLWFSTRLAFAVGADISLSIYRTTLYQPYDVHCRRNSSEIIDGISGKANRVIYSVIVPTLTIISSSILLVIIFVALIVINPSIALVIFGGFGTIYYVIIQTTKSKLESDGLRAARETTNVIKALQEGLGGIRDVLIDGAQYAYCQIYRRADLALRHVQGNNMFLSTFPRFPIEALGMCLIAISAYWLSSKSSGIASVIPTLGALAIGAQRSLPILQQAFRSWSSIKGGQAALEDTIELLEQEMPSHLEQPERLPLRFERDLVLKKISYQYSPSSPYVLTDLSLQIKKGEHIGFIGTTGGGKSTLLDIIMGLLHPVSGSLEIDGKVLTASNINGWRSHIAHVPQTIFLVDSSIEENIAFGIPASEIDHARVKLAADKAQISETIEGWKNKYKTFVGERGIRLSGGQRQRIGIARAFYKQASVLIFDEATSALDDDTERMVSKTLTEITQGITVLIIAHRISTLKDCARIVQIEAGAIRKISNYAALDLQQRKKMRQSKGT